MVLVVKATIINSGVSRNVCATSTMFFMKKWWNVAIAIEMTMNIKL